MTWVGAELFIWAGRAEAGRGAEQKARVFRRKRRGCTNIFFGGTNKGGDGKTEGGKGRDNEARETGMASRREVGGYDSIAERNEKSGICDWWREGG